MTTATMANLQIWKELCRYDSGRHFLDSGGAYGRHHEKPPIARDAFPITLYLTEGEVLPTIETWALLDDALVINHEWQEEFENGWDGDLTWAEEIEKFVKSKGFHGGSGGYTYGTPNALSQDIVWSVSSTEPGDVWNTYEETITVVQIHTGCDARGGFSKPIICEGAGDYPFPVDLEPDIRVESIVDFDRTPVEQGTLVEVFEEDAERRLCEEISEEWEGRGEVCYHFGQLVDVVHEDTYEKDQFGASVEVTLKDTIEDSWSKPKDVPCGGRRIKVSFSMPYR